VLWLDDHVDDLLTPIHPSLRRQRPALFKYLRDCLVEFLSDLGGAASEDEVRRYLSEMGLGASSALTFIEHECGSLAAFVATHAPGTMRFRRMIGRDVLHLRGATAASLQDARRGRAAKDAYGDYYDDAVMAAKSMLAGVSEAPVPADPETAQQLNGGVDGDDLEDIRDPERRR